MRPADDDGERVDGMEGTGSTAAPTKGSPASGATSGLSPQQQQEQQLQQPAPGQQCGGALDEHEVKLECQMFKVREDEYMLDVQVCN
jgi:hypothetical protein